MAQTLVAAILRHKGKGMGFNLHSSKLVLSADCTYYSRPKSLGLYIPDTFSSPQEEYSLAAH